VKRFEEFEAWSAEAKLRSLGTDLT
jgi:hypothetical protein